MAAGAKGILIGPEVARLSSSRPENDGKLDVSSELGAPFPEGGFQGTIAKRIGRVLTGDEHTENGKTIFKPFWAEIRRSGSIEGDLSGLPPQLARSSEFLRAQNGRTSYFSMVKGSSDLGRPDLWQSIEPVSRAIAIALTIVEVSRGRGARIASQPDRFHRFVRKRSLLIFSFQEMINIIETFCCRGSTFLSLRFPGRRFPASVFLSSLSLVPKFVIQKLILGAHST